MTATKFSTKPVEVSPAQISIVLATRASKDAEGKEKPAAHVPYYAAIDLPAELTTISDEVLRLAAISGLSDAYQKAARAKLPVRLLANAGGAEQEVTITNDDLRAILAAESTGQRITKEAVTEAWKIVVSTALHNLCKVKGVASESALPDIVRRQVGAQLQRRCDFLLSMASTTGLLSYSEEAITANLAWLATLAEQEANSGGWLFAACLDKASRRLEKLAADRAAAEAEAADAGAEIDLDALF